jgi:hypothetical protein
MLSSYRTTNGRRRMLRECCAYRVEAGCVDAAADVVSLRAFLRDRSAVNGCARLTRSLQTPYCTSAVGLSGKRCPQQL